MGRSRGVVLDPKPGSSHIIGGLEDNLDDERTGATDTPNYDPDAGKYITIDEYEYDDKYLFGTQYTPSAEQVVEGIWKGDPWVKTQIANHNAYVVKRARILTYLDRELGVKIPPRLSMAGLGSGKGGGVPIKPINLPELPPTIIPSVVSGWRAQNPDLSDWNDEEIMVYLRSNEPDGYAAALQAGAPVIDGVSDMFRVRRVRDSPVRPATGTPRPPPRQPTSSTDPLPSSVPYDPLPFDPLRDDDDDSANDSANDSVVIDINGDSANNSDDEKDPLLPGVPRQRRGNNISDDDDENNPLLGVNLHRLFELDFTGPTPRVVVRQGLSPEDKKRAAALLVSGTAIVGIITATLASGSNGGFTPATPAPTTGTTPIPTPGNPGTTPAPTPGNPGKPLKPIKPPRPIDPKTDPKSDTTDPNPPPPPPSPSEIPKVPDVDADETFYPEVIDTNAINGQLRPHLKVAGTNSVKISKEEEHQSDLAKMSLVLTGTEFDSQDNSLFIEEQRNLSIRYHKANAFSTLEPGEKSNILNKKSRPVTYVKKEVGTRLKLVSASYVPQPFTNYNLKPGVVL